VESDHNLRGIAGETPITGRIVRVVRQTLEKVGQFELAVQIRGWIPSKTK